MLSDLDSQKYKILKWKSKYYPAMLNLEDAVDIKLNWHQEKI